MVFVVDGSPDNCYELLRQDLPNRKFRSQLILLSRNFGSFMAIRTGFQFASGERFAVMAADLQEPPELISSMNSLLITQNFDIVVGVRDGRDDPFMSRTASRIFWGLYRPMLFRKYLLAALIFLPVTNLSGTLKISQSLLPRDWGFRLINGNFISAGRGLGCHLRLIN